MTEKIGNKSTEEVVALDVIRVMLGGASERDLREIEQKQLASDDYQREFDKGAQLLVELEPLEHDSRLLAAVERYESKVYTETERRRYWPKLAAAAAVVASICVALFTTLVDQPPVGETLRFSTQIGEQKSFTLKDGSVIHLNTGSLLLVTQGELEREVIMERGEVYFDVASDPDRPFKVNIGAQSVTVLGTAFNIFRSPEKSQLAVFEGAVVLHDKESSFDSAMVDVNTSETQELIPGGQYILKRGAVVDIDRDHWTGIAATENQLATIQQWRSGIYRFDDVPLSRVIQELNRYSAKKILIEDASIMDQRVFATIKVGQPSMALLALERLLPIRVIKHFDRIVIVKDEEKI